MKEFWKNLTGKQIVLAVTAAVSLVIFGILTGISGYIAGKQPAQNMAQRWAKEGGSAQISCFFSQTSQVDENTIQAFEHALDSALQEASITVDSPNASARLWADAYSTGGKMTIEGKTGKVDTNVLGVGGDFFLFHPLKLLSGSFFSGSDLMQDHIVIDEDLAWQLFGSNDVVGQQVTINGIPHLISGVIKRDTGRFNDKAGNGKPLAYVSFDTLASGLEAVGQTARINQYEIVLPNPVNEFAYGMVKDHIGVEETDCEIVENSNRYGFVRLLKLLGNFGVRSMNEKAIIYPYWENLARGYEDVLVLILVFRILFVVYPAVLFIILVVYQWKHRKWHFKDLKNFIEDKAEEKRLKRHQRKVQKSQDSVVGEEEELL